MESETEWQNSIPAWFASGPEFEFPLSIYQNFIDSCKKDYCKIVNSYNEKSCIYMYI